MTVTCTDGHSTLISLFWPNFIFIKPNANLTLEWRLDLLHVACYLAQCRYISAPWTDIYTGSLTSLSGWMHPNILKNAALCLTAYLKAVAPQTDGLMLHQCCHKSVSVIKLVTLFLKPCLILLWFHILFNSCLTDVIEPSDMLWVEDFLTNWLIDPQWWIMLVN